MAVALAPRPMTPTSNLRTGAEIKTETTSDKSTPPKADGAAAAAPAPVRPPNKPSQSLRLEPNPFEQSFSQSSTSLPKLADARSNGDRSPRLPALKSPRLSSSPTDGAKSLTTPKPILPPVAAISSPSTGFEWQSGDLSSLRSGPLSPAMLAGPRERPTPSGLTPFVGGEFRSGLTPDVGRTGLTPLVGGPVSFPPPSPNTAAFLAMVTNGANGTNGLQGPEATITPNTLNALTGVLNGLSTNNVPGGPGNDNLHPNSAANQQHATYANDPKYGNYYPPAGADPRTLPSGQQAPAPAPVPGQQPVNGQNGYAPAASSATAHAATGLFLLSQAHQELTRREEMERLAQEQAAQQQGGENGNRMRRMSTISASTNDTQSPVVGKRKSSDGHNGPVPQQQTNGRAQQAARPSKRAKTTKNAKRHTSIEDDELGGDDDEFDDDEMMGGQSQGTELVKRPETDEDKRKNFLERNRQAALKCRQRKKAWLQQLQQKVEFLTAENERLHASLGGAREEVQRLTAALVSHRDCPLHPPSGLPQSHAISHPHLAQHPGHSGPAMNSGMPPHHQPAQYGPPMQHQGVTPPHGPHAAISVPVPVGAQGRGGGFGY
ncbi:hypothetical protein DACRYDRAFT_24992 [Dacryopinax primogenitus]|uniref:BZIP domain-containing protein n=1 Tax=Dacryopinax primogenitus (strain DJM 731) TaxID=1858805 RepID=M5FRJ4_DACPD|nr:uncharacterized protein DACRYDRAFT_24992 [Dacryopinax primogenitus]EJT97614.1 hypothetical protein DACRYDRAFT_24992 [Dacryopinax primogenitus]